MELYKVMLTNNEDCYVVAEDESQARDKVKDYIRDRYIIPVHIDFMELIAETKVKGFATKLVI